MRDEIYNGSDFECLFITNESGLQIGLSKACKKENDKHYDDFTKDLTHPDPRVRKQVTDLTELMIQKNSK